MSSPAGPTPRISVLARAEVFALSFPIPFLNDRCDNDEVSARAVGRTSPFSLGYTKAAQRGRCLPEQSLEVAR